MVITIDDLPLNSRLREIDWQQELTTRLLAALQQHSVPGIGFVNEQKLSQRGKVLAERVALLEQWLAAGQELGNHTFSHPDYHRQEFEEFRQDIVLGERETRKLLQARGDSLQYFRHPFLHSGNSPEKKAALETFLNEAGYTIAPVTIDNSEWIFARGYENAFRQGDSVLMQRVGEAYLSYMEDQTAYYESQSRKLFEREIPQILLIHANQLNADYLEQLLRVFVERGYRFVSLASALADPAYQSADAYTGMGGISWMHRWALTRKVEKSFFEGEARTPTFVQEVAEITE